ncbi:MAG: RHS repeat-associated core domain-containing protein, partial [Bacteroidales bacterium]|nr:RHS repeat-associated core domain-containing protein [Bacteroidales bacterium]
MKTNVTYHTDHLGNNSFVTDNSGKAIQELRYTPYGEILSNKRSTGSNYNTPYKFSAKEKDQETGFNYFGARYYVD